MKELLKYLVQQNLITEGDIETILKKASEREDGVEGVLADEWGIEQDVLLTGKAAESPLEGRRVEIDSLSQKLLELIPEDSAQHYKFVPIGIQGNVLEVGIVDPENIQARDALNFISARAGLKYEMYLITQKDFQEVLEKYESMTGEVSEALTELESELQTQDEGIPDLSDIGGTDDEEATRIIEDAPVTKIVATILGYATEGRASDIHIEPVDKNVRVRFRVDGVLGTSLMLPIKVHSAVVARIKILSNMRLDEKRKPQDGRFSATIAGRPIDFRVSTFPTYYGEKIVMRILDQVKGVKKLDDLGLSPRNLKLLKDVIKEPFGLVLISGPTGSGKTTTLYGLLHEIDKERKNVLSLEDPVEYNVDGVSQSQVRADIGYTFANGLRTTLRQDPDVIMVGEIRDGETAKLAIQASLTGHLVVSTIHTNNAIGVIPRLIDMGIDPYLIAPTLKLAVAQRLVHSLCEGSGKEVPISDSMQQMIDREFSDLPEEYKAAIPFQNHVFEPSSTPECPTGVRGRTAIMEVVQMNEALEQTLLTNPNEVEILKTARQQGMITMKEDAIIKAMNKEIPYTEISQIG